jgi:hypothetical protein
MSAKSEAEKKPLTVINNSQVPDYLRPEIGQQHGMEDVTNEDLLIPRLGLCQALSPQKRKSDSSYIEGLQEGQLFNTVTKEIYGESLEFVMLYFFKNRIKYVPLDDGGGIDCISTNGIDGGRISPQGCASCRFSQWGNGATDDENGNDAPECTLYHNYMSAIEGVPLAVSYKSTGIKISKQILANVRITRLPMYAKKYKVTVVEMQKDKNVWFEKKITPLGFVDQATFNQCEELFNGLKAVSIHIDTTGEAGDTAFEGDSGPDTHTEL